MGVRVFPFTAGMASHPFALPADADDVASSLIVAPLYGGTVVASFRYCAELGCRSEATEEELVETGLAVTRASQSARELCSHGRHSPAVASGI